MSRELGLLVQVWRSLDLWLEESNFTGMPQPSVKCASCSWRTDWEPLFEHKTPKSTHHSSSLSSWLMLETNPGHDVPYLVGLLNSTGRSCTIFWGRLKVPGHTSDSLSHPSSKFSTGGIFNSSLGSLDFGNKMENAVLIGKMFRQYTIWTRAV